MGNKQFDWVHDFNADRTIGGLALLKVNFIGNELANNILDSAIAYLKNSQRVGAWIRHGEPPIYVVECSLCGQKYHHHALSQFSKYCSECGAKMESWICENQTEAKKSVKEKIAEEINEALKDNERRMNL